MTRRIEILLIFLLMAVVTSSAGILHSWDITHGMLKEKVTGMVQDERGFLWLSTWGGLYRYDGRSFRSYKTCPGDGSTMSYNRLDAVKVDKYGNLWCRSFYHPYCFEVKTSTFIDVTEKLEQATRQTFNVHQIYPMKSGYVWLQTDKDAAIRVSIDNPKESARLYSPSNGRLKKGKIISINEDCNGRAWILSEGGMSAPGMRVSFPNKRFDYWYETSPGCIYLATKEGELWHLDSRTWKMRRVTLPLSSKKILRLSGYKNGELVVATDKALLTYHKGRWGIHKYEKNSISSVKRLHRDSQGRYWMISDRPGVMLLKSIDAPLVEMNAEKEENYENKHDSWFFSEQADGIVLLMSRNEGLCYYDAKDGTLKHVKENTGKPYQPQVGRTFIDAENNVWLYNTTDGLERVALNRNPFVLDNSGASVYTLHYDKRGRLWKGAVNGILTIDDTNYNIGIVYAIEEMPDGVMWVGTKDKGLYRFIPRGEGDFSIRQFTHEEKDRYSISGNDVFCMTQDRKGNLWVGTYSGGLNIVDRDNGRRETVRFANKNNTLKCLPTDERSLNIRSLLYTREGILCVGTSNGIYAFKEQNKVIHNRRKADDANSLSNNEIMQMHQDVNGDVYCITPSSGICRTKATSLLTDSASFIIYDHRSLAPYDTPLSVTEDSHGNLWIAYTNSVAMFNRRRTVFYNWSAPAMTFAEMITGNSGQIIAGTIGGTLSWQPSKMHLDNSAPRIAISALTVSGREVDYDADLRDTIRFGSAERDISMQLATLTMRQGEKTKYAYRMDGDSMWVTQGDNYQLAFLNLSAGYHSLQLRSTNASGVWCDNYRTVTLYVTPTFWETPWAVLIYILLGIMVIGGIALIWAYVYRLRLIMRTQEEEIKQRMHFIHNVAPLIREDKDDLLERVRKYIDEHISDEGLTIPSIAAEVSMSRASFFSRFKELAGISPQDYLIHYRIAYARQLLSVGGMSVAEVAYKSGFADPKYFSRVFKKIEGVSPSAVGKTTV